MSQLFNRLPYARAFSNYLYSVTFEPVPSVDIPSVDIHDVETAPEKRPRTLKHLLKANHVNHSMLYHDLEYHNHAPHILCSAYQLGASPEQLHHIYEREEEELEGWHDSPAEISEGDWQDFLGDARYQRAYVDFFEDSLAYHFQYNWKECLGKYLLSGDEPLVNCLISGLGHPLIHLGYAYEFSSREIAMEALAMAATGHNFLHKYSDDKSYTKPSSTPSASPHELLQKLAKDSRLDGVFSTRGAQNIGPLFEQHEDLLMEYWNAWAVDDNPTKQFQQSQEAAVSLLVATVQTGTHAYDFFLVHVLTTSHAVRILLPLLPKKYHISLIRQWWLLALTVYVIQMRPTIEDSLIGRPGLGDKNWHYVEDRAVNGPWKTDSHFVKAVRALREAAFTWGDVHEWYLTAAVTFTDTFAGWTGFE